VQELFFGFEGLWRDLAEGVPLASHQLGLAAVDALVAVEFEQLLVAEWCIHVVEAHALTVKHALEVD